MTTEQEIEIIDKTIEELNAILDEKSKNWDYQKTWEEYCDMRHPEQSVIEKLDAKKRMIMSYTLEEIPEYGDVMSLKDFVKSVNDGWFIDYDGSGNYATKDKMTNISIYPSDVEKGNIRKDFDSIVWFNR